MSESPHKRPKIEGGPSPKTGTPFAPVAKVIHESKAQLDVKALRPPGTDTFRIITGADRRTLPSMTLVERVGAKGVRAQHLASGGDTTAKCSDDITDPIMLAEEEQKGVAPIYFLRPVPGSTDGTVFERFHMNELEKRIKPAMQDFDRNALPL